MLARSDVPSSHDAPSRRGEGDHPSRPTTAALIGLVAGGLGGLIALSWGIGMPWLGLVALLVGCLVPPRPFGLAGTLSGWGILSIALFLRADASCDAASCEGPDITPWLALAGALVLAGLIVLAIGVVRRRRRS